MEIRAPLNRKTQMKDIKTLAKLEQVNEKQKIKRMK